MAQSIIDKIRAELNRRYEENREKARYDDYYRGMNDGLDKLEQFLDILQEEPLPKDCELVTADEDIITIHLGRVVSDEVYDQIVKDIVRLLERKYPSDANWYLDS